MAKPTNSTPGELAKSYDPAAEEPKVRAAWDASRAFHAEPVADGPPPYCIVIPPPNVTAALHLGHALNNTLQDVLIRFHRAQGRPTLWMPGTDHAGIATQAVVDKRLIAEGQPSLKDYKRLEAEGQGGRAQFIAKVQAWKDEYEATIIEQLKLMGCSCDWDRTRFTMDEMCARAVREAFFRLFKDGLIYRGKRLVNWDPALQTAVADDECFDKEIEGQFYYLRYPLVPLDEPRPNEPRPSGSGSSPLDEPRPSGSGSSPLDEPRPSGSGSSPLDEPRPSGSGSSPLDEPRPSGSGSSPTYEEMAGENFITVATTRPETMLGDSGVAVNPKDPRAAALKGRCVKLPLVGRDIPIVLDDYVVLPVSLGGDEKDPKSQFATGFLKVTPAHDPNDWEIGRRHNLEAINIFAPDASVSDKHGWSDIGDAGFLVGLDRFEARKAIVKCFEETGVLAEKKPYRHSVSHSDRSKAIIEPYLSDQWYVRVTDDKMRGNARRAMAADQTSRAREEAVLAEQRSYTAAPTNPAETSRAREEAALAERPPLDLHPVSTAPYPVYFLTWTTYGTWLHGDERGSVDRDHNERHSPFLVEDERRRFNEGQRAEGDAITLDLPQRRIVCAKIEEVCAHRGWTLLAVNVRTNHVHVVVSATSKEPENAMTDLKAYATRGLVEAGTTPHGTKVWTRHGSTKWLNDAESVRAACRYVLLEQGENMAGTVSGACGTGDRPTPLPHGRGSSGQALPGSARDEKRSAETSRARKEAALAEQRSHTADPGNYANAQPSRADEAWQGGLRFHPERYAKTFENWHENIRDWCISRQLWWGHRIPVWTSPIFPLDESHGLPDSQAWAIKKIDFLSEDEHQRIAFQVRPEPGVLVLHVCCMVDNESIEQKLEQNGFVQDPDVLDTWFSSALWPLSTMGWPDPESYDATRGDGHAPNLLDFFNPTNVLCTAREIITLWVSRMVMFNLYFTQDTDKGQRLPFRDVFIHAMIQDGQGRKMSKSLGNGVDPRDIIRSKGADAMRFTLVQMTTQTQDVRMPVEYDAAIDANTSPKFELGRRLANKIWNATRFAIGILSGPTSETPVPPTGEPTRLIDRWMLSRLARTLTEVEKSIRQYDFSVYAQQMYDLFWRDLCDWYLEAIKPTVRDDATQQRVLRSSLGSINRMFHPIMPFVTESLHASIEALPVEPLEEIELPASDLAATARWPIIPDTFLDDAAERDFARIQELVAIIREVRSVQKVHDRRMITLHVADDATMQLIEQAQGVVEVLAGLGSVSLEAARGGEGVTFLFGNVEHQLTDLTEAIDVSAERDRLARQRADVEKRITGLTGRLSNKGYIEKAPAKLVEETKRQLAESQAELDSIIQSLGKLIS